MNLSYKAVNFIIEAIDYRIKAYEERLTEIDDVDEYEDEASDIGNDCGFLEAIRDDLVKALEKRQTPTVLKSRDRDSVVTMDMRALESLSVPDLGRQVLELSTSDRLLLINAIADSIRQEIAASNPQASSEEESALGAKVASAS